MSQSCKEEFVNGKRDVVAVDCAESCDRMVSIWMWISWGL